MKSLAAGLSATSAEIDSGLPSRVDSNFTSAASANQGISNSIKIDKSFNIHPPITPFHVRRGCYVLQTKYVHGTAAWRSVPLGQFAVTARCPKAISIVIETQVHGYTGPATNTREHANVLFAF